MADIYKMAEAHQACSVDSGLEKLGDSVEEAVHVFDEKELSEERDLTFVCRVGDSYYYDAEGAGFAAILEWETGAPLNQSTQRFSNDALAVLDAVRLAEENLVKQKYIDQITELEIDVDLLEEQKKTLPNDIEIAKAQVAELEKALHDEKSPSEELVLSTLSNIVMFGVVTAVFSNVGEKLMLMSRRCQTLYYLFQKERHLKGLCGGQLPPLPAGTETFNRYAAKNLGLLGLPVAAATAVYFLRPFLGEILGTTDPKVIRDEWTKASTDEISSVTLAAAPEESSLQDLSFEELEIRARDLTDKKRKLMHETSAITEELKEYNRVKDLRSRELIQKIDPETILSPDLKAILERMQSDPHESWLLGSQMGDAILETSLGPYLGHGVEIGVSFGVMAHVLTGFINGRYKSHAITKGFEALNAAAEKDAKKFLADHPEIVGECRANEETAQEKVTIKVSDKVRGVNPVIAPNAAPALGRAVPGAQSVLSSAATLVSETWAGLKPAPTGELAMNGASNYARGGVSGRGSPAPTNSSLRVMNADAAAPPGWVRLPGGGAVPASDASVSGRGNPAPTSAKPSVSDVGAGSPRPTARSMAKAGAGMAATTLVVAGLEMYADEKLNELGIPEENQDALFDATNAGLLGYTVYANPVTVGGLPWAYLGGDLAQTETRSLVEEHVPEPWQDTVTQSVGVVGGGTGFVTGMGITYAIGTAAGGTTLLEISVLGGPVTILAGAIGYALYQDYKQYRYLKETREHFLTQAPQAEREAFIALSATLELGLQGKLTHEKLQKIRDVISKEPYQSFLDQNGQYFIDAYLDPFISDYTAVPHVPASLLLPVLLASNVGSPSSEPKRDYTLDLGLIRDEILHPYADEWNAEIYRYTDPLTGLPSMIPPSEAIVSKPVPKKSDTTMVSVATPSGVGAGSPRPVQKPFTTDSAEPRLIYDTTKQGEVLYAELVKQYPFEQRNLSLQVSDTCKKLHADGKYTVAAEILNRWLQDAQKMMSESRTSYTAAFKEATTFTNPFTGETFEGFSPTGVIDSEESRDLTINYFLPLEEQIARYAHGDIADISEVLTKLNELEAKMADATGFDLWKDLF